MITSISLICKQNYTTPRPALKAKAIISKSISTKRWCWLQMLPQPRLLTKVERSKINIDEPLKEIIIGLLLGD